MTRYQPGDLFSCEQARWQAQGAIGLRLEQLGEARLWACLVGGLRGARVGLGKGLQVVLGQAEVLAFEHAALVRIALQLLERLTAQPVQDVVVAQDGRDRRDDGETQRDLRQRLPYQAPRVGPATHAAGDWELVVLSWEELGHGRQVLDPKARCNARIE